MCLNGYAAQNRQALICTVECSERMVLNQFNQKAI